GGIPAGSCRLVLSCGREPQECHAIDRGAEAIPASRSVRHTALSSRDDGRSGSCLTLLCRLSLVKRQTGDLRTGIPAPTIRWSARGSIIGRKLLRKTQVQLNEFVGEFVAQRQDPPSPSGIRHSA